MFIHTHTHKKDTNIHSVTMSEGTIATSLEIKLRAQSGIVSCRAHVCCSVSVLLCVAVCQDVPICINMYVAAWKYVCCVARPEQHCGLSSACVLQSVAECCRVLQSVAECCSVSICVDMRQHVCCRVTDSTFVLFARLERHCALSSACVLQFVPMCCIVSRCVKIDVAVWKSQCVCCVACPERHCAVQSVCVAACCSMLYRVALCCSMLQCGHICELQCVAINMLVAVCYALSSIASCRAHVCCSVVQVVAVNMCVSECCAPRAALRAVNSTH